MSEFLKVKRTRVQLKKSGNLTTVQNMLQKAEYEAALQV
jgi:hypothetical protein